MVLAKYLKHASKFTEIQRAHSIYEKFIYLVKLHNVPCIRDVNSPNYKVGFSYLLCERFQIKMPKLHFHPHLKAEIVMERCLANYWSASIIKMFTSQTRWDLWLRHGQKLKPTTG